MTLVSYTEISKFLPVEAAIRYNSVPFKMEDRKLTLLTDSTQYREDLANELEIITGFEIELVREEPKIIADLLKKLYRSTGQSQVESKPTGIHRDDFLIKIIYEALELKSSDIHIEAYSEKCRIRFRIDGKLLERYHVPKDDYSAFINRIKIKAKLDIAEKRLPQDGRILHIDENTRIDIRVSALPTLYGEKVVLRLLKNDASHIDLRYLGLDAEQLTAFEGILKNPHGIILISGPTGSGKTTTLYATLKVLNKEDNNILTIEDPIEYTLEGVNQVQLRENIGLDFASALRTFLRQDPDIIMLGEIRDGGTAQMAIRAALTGHLVLSTIHTNSAWGTISRLSDMGIPPFLLASTINMTIAQRLVRKLCSVCKTTSKGGGGNYLDTLTDLERMSDYYIPVGCASCYFTGYSGRIAIYEVVPIEAELASAIRNNLPEIDEYLKKRHISTLKGKAIDLLRSGETSVEEVYPILLNH